MKKTIILIMGTNEHTDPYFRNEYETCCKNTWMKRLDSNKYGVIYYQGGDETKFDGDILTVACEDDLEHTYKKTYLALDYIYKNFNFDLIFRTNTSTYINAYLLDMFIDNIYDNKFHYGSDIYSLSEGYAPYPLLPYRRGNGILYSKKDVENILINGINILYANMTDDIGLDNTINSIDIQKCMRAGIHYEPLLHRGIPHAWYKCIDTTFQNNHKLSTFNESDKYWMTPTITVKKYRQRDKEFDNYIELDNIIRNLHYPDSSVIINKMREYSENYSIFIGSILGYLDFAQWKTIDKNKLYLLEIANKASDDDEHYKRKELQGNFDKFDFDKLYNIE